MKNLLRYNDKKNFFEAYLLLNFKTLLGFDKDSKLPLHQYPVDVPS